MCSSTKEIRGELRKSKNKLSESELYQLLTKIDAYEFMYSITAHIWSFKVLKIFGKYMPFNLKYTFLPKEKEPRPSDST